MNEDQLAHWGPYLRDLSDRMGLRDWSIILRKKLGSKRFGATVDCPYGRKIIVIRLGGDFLTSRPDQQRHYLVHELVHVHLWGVQLAVRDVQESVGGRWSQLFSVQLRNVEEYAVDGLTDVLAPFLPLPPGAETEVAA